MKNATKFPKARIRKIMQLDKEVGKMSEATPVAISRAVELFFDDLVEEMAQVAVLRGSRTVTRSHLKSVIQGHENFDFLRDLFKDVPDISLEPLKEVKRGRKPKLPPAGEQRLPAVKGSRGRKRKANEYDDDAQDAAWESGPSRSPQLPSLLESSLNKKRRSSKDNLRNLLRSRNIKVSPPKQERSRLPLPRNPSSTAKTPAGSCPSSHKPMFVPQNASTMDYNTVRDIVSGNRDEGIESSGAPQTASYKKQQKSDPIRIADLLCSTESGSEDNNPSEKSANVCAMDGGGLQKSRAESLMSLRPLNGSN